MDGSRISVVIVSDYAAAGARPWADEIACAEAFRRQDLAVPPEILVVAGQGGASAPDPPLPPGVGFLRLPHATSTALRDAALPHVRGDLVAVVEADCLPAPDWLRLLAARLAASSECQAVSGRTTYGAGGSLLRIAALLDRGYVEQPAGGATRHVCSNGALYRRAFLARHRFPDEPNPFVATWLRNEAILAAGERLEVEPAAVMVHAHGGLAFARDLRRNVGFRDARDWGRGPGLRSILRVWRHRQRLERQDLRRLGRLRLRWWDWPLVPPLQLLRRLLELPGIRAGLRGESLTKTGYR
jgi:hypothetical protein